MKQKGSASVGYWVQYVTLNFYLTHDLDLGCFKVKFRNSSISGIVDLIDVKLKQSELIWYWANCMTLPFYHTHYLDPGVEISRSKSEKSFISGMGWPAHGTKRMWVIHSWPWYWLVWPWWGGQMYRIVTGVTSDVGVPSTYLVACSAPSHYLNQCWLIVIRTLRNKLRWISYQNTKLFIHGNAFENVFWEMVAILSRGRWYP